MASGRHLYKNKGFENEKILENYNVFRNSSTCENYCKDYYSNPNITY